MNYKHLFFIVFAFLTFGCKQEKLSLTKIEGKQININDSLAINPEIEAFIKPYREHVNKDLDSVISYAVDTYSKKDGNYNTAIGNLFADAVIQESNIVFNKRTGKNIDMVLLNHGGIRAIISKGNISTRTAYEIMPFENSLVVAEMKGKTIQDSLVHYLTKAKRAHPISGLKIKMDKDFNVIETSINNKPIEANKSYYVVTNDYLYNGGDRMTFFKTNDSLYVLNYKVRNALVDYFKKTDTINPVIDDRFIQTK
ncbi:5'-nucleotidase C-terminal domain-containing protein [Lacinutrix gracilariae]|uniref:5'-nucleotidase C-terminal domain-containing protein n=1 Tax=Lacinutrix gracilariae TaxID=1747198 RepID=A0ABW5K4M9_9FLAO